LQLLACPTKKRSVDHNIILLLSLLHRKMHLS